MGVMKFSLIFLLSSSLLNFTYSKNNELGEAYQEYLRTMAEDWNRWGTEALCKNPSKESESAGIFFSIKNSGKLYSIGKFNYQGKFMTVFEQEYTSVEKNKDGTFNLESWYYFKPENKNKIKKSIVRFEYDPNYALIFFRLLYTEEDGKILTKDGINLENQKPTERVYNCGQPTWGRGN